MKILYFHQYFKTPEGSGGTRSYEMARYFVDKGHHVTMVYSISDRTKSPLSGPYINGKRQGSVDGIDLIEFNLNYSNKLNFLQRTKIYISFSLKSVSLVFKERFDIVFATSTPLTAGIPGIVMKFLRRNNPFVFEVRDLWPELPKEMGVIKNKFVLWMMDLLETISYNTADACIALSPGIAAGIKKKLKKVKPVYIIPNGCDLDLFKPGNSSKSIFPETGEDDLVAIFTGAHGIANGLDAVLNAANVLKENGFERQIKLVFIGDGMLKEKLVARAKNENLSNCIFLDPVPKNELIKYLHAADVGLMILANIPAFYYGTSPNKFFDYISIGMPVLNNYPGWLAEMISENKCGLVVEPDDSIKFADALIFLYRNKNQISQMGANGRALAEREFNRLRLADNLLSALSETFSKYSRDQELSNH
jgi:glycosyltransferase involved in cell wall biosynthesis